MISYRVSKKKDKSEKLHTHPDHVSSVAKMNTDTEIIAKSLKKWEEAKFDKNIQQRSYHSSVVYNANLYVFGGYEINIGIMNDFYSLDLENKDFFSWTPITKSSEKSVYPGLQPFNEKKNLVYNFRGLASPYGSSLPE